MECMRRVLGVKCQHVKMSVVAYSPDSSHLVQYFRLTIPGISSSLSKCREVQSTHMFSCLLIHRKTPAKAEFEGETKAFRHSKTSPATARGLVNGIFLGHLWDLLLWLWSSGRTATSRQVSRHGGVAGMLRSKSTDTRAGPTEALLLRFSLGESCGFFAAASLFGRCPRSTGGSDVRPQGD